MAEEYLYVFATYYEPHCGQSLFIDQCTRLETGYTWVMPFTDCFFIDINSHAGFMLTVLM